ncbi:hypothetical protein LguiB_028230 [Lonicera macranthoides]
MTRDNLMTVSKRQRKRVKHVAKTSLKEYGTRKKPTPPALESPPHALHVGPKPLH